MGVSYFQFQAAGPELIWLPASILLDGTVLQLDLEMVSDAVYPISHSSERRRVDTGTTHATNHGHWKDKISVLRYSSMDALCPCHGGNGIMNCVLIAAYLQHGPI